MRNVVIKGYGSKKPDNKVLFGDQTRYRCTDKEDQLSLAVEASLLAIKSSGLTINDIDCIVSASAVGVQPIPATSVLIHEQIAKGTNIPAMDINTTCTSFIAAFDVMSYMIDAGRYKNVLIVSSDLGSAGLNPKQKESYELFSDAAAAIILSKSEDPNEGVIFSEQMTWSEGAHHTEIRGGLTAFLPSNYTEKTKAEYFFDMKGKSILSLTARKIPELFKSFTKKSGMTIKDIDLLIPHQASKALDMVMHRLKVPKDKYINKVTEYGNMVSAAVPFILCEAIDEKRIKKGDTIMIVGTAAGLTGSLLVFKY